MRQEFPKARTITLNDPPMLLADLWIVFEKKEVPIAIELLGTNVSLLRS
jgi:hypothetical protein